ncbi:MAG: hypothetical protein HDQ87_05520 [Clostridia bacterium]|nr:hypothetical protein [Clostridia bacterium]
MTQEKETSLPAEGQAEHDDVGQTEPAAAAPDPIEPTRRQRLMQIILGWLAGFLIWFCMALGLMFPENQLLGWSFLIVFAAAMFGRNEVARRTGLDLRTYMRSFLISLIVFLAVFIIVGPVMHLLPGG